MSADPTWTDIAQVSVVALQLVVLIVAAAVAWRQVLEARRLREERARPFVVADLDVERHILFFVVANIGPSLARNVRLEISPPLTGTVERVPFSELKMLSDGIPNLAPAKEYRTILDSFIRREQTGEFPDVYKVVISYTDETGRRPFREEHILDIGLYRNLLYVTDNDVRDIKKSLAGMHKVMKKWTAGSQGGLLTLSPIERDLRAERTRRELEQRHASLRRPAAASSEPDASGG